jgi:SAM-dependent methyltransferase
MRETEIEASNRTYHVAQDHMSLLPNYYKWMYGKFGEYLHGRVVELGCGSGIGISTYLERATTVYAVDYNEELMRRVKQRFPSAKVVTIQADLVGDWKELFGTIADSVVMMDVLEHFADDEMVIRNAAALLEPGGHLLVKVPAGKALFSSVDRASGHFRRYDESDLRGLLESAGFHTVRLGRMNPVGALAYRLKKRKNTNFSRTFSMRQLRAINLALPILSWFDHVPLLPGLSLVGVFRKT